MGRLVPGVRTLISIPAGLASMARGRFLAYSAVGTVLWTALLAWAGTVLQHNFGLVEGYVDRFTQVLLAIVLVSVAWRYARCCGLIGPMARASHRA